MINFVLKYTGSYGLLAILAVAIITPTFFFFARQQEQLSQLTVEQQDVNKEEYSRMLLLLWLWRVQATLGADCSIGERSRCWKNDLLVGAIVFPSGSADAGHVKYCKPGCDSGVTFVNDTFFGSLVYDAFQRCKGYNLQP